MMTDDEFLQAFANCTLSNHDFRHRDHLRLAWLQVNRQGPEGAARAITQGIKRFAASKGAHAKYHETMTLFWVRAVAHMAVSRPDIHEFDLFLEAFPMLLDKSLPLRHFTSDTLMSQEARAAWVEPDLQPIPA